ncbi:hypothetical protein CGRA01v4_12920 [Colletotrichum graminicola]|nr:hypothetical protein CGRA01v4_12920 [Colletotrichum graminicola]
MNDPAVEKLKKQMDELLAEKAMREQQSMQEYIQKTTLEVAVQQTAEVVREVQGQAQLDIEIATVKAEIMAQEKAERSQREKKQIQDQTRLEVEREFALKLAQEKAMREELIETIREEFREKERRAMELEEIIQRIRHEAERKAYHVHSASSIGTPHPTARRPPPVSVFNMEPRFEYEASFDDIDSNGPGTNHYQQYHSRTSSTGLSEESVRLPPPAPSAPSPSIVGGIYSHTTSAPSVVLSRASGVSRQQNRHMDFQSRSVQVNVPDLREIPMNHEEHVPNTRYQSWAIEDSDEEGSEAYKSARTSPIPMGGGDGNNPKEGRNQDSTTESRNGGEAVSGRFGLPFGSQKPAIPKKDGVSNQQGGTLPVSPPMNAGSTAEIGKNVRQSQNPSRDPGRILSSSVGQFTEERRTELGQHGQKMERHVGVAGSPVPTAKMQPANDGGHPREDRQTYTVAEGLLGGHMHFPHASLDQSYIYDGGDGRTESIQQYQPAIAPIRMVPMMVIMAPYQYQAPVTLPSGPIPPNLSGNPGHPGPHSRQNERTG